MARIIVNTLQKRNETGLMPFQTFFLTDMYKSTRHERLNLYRCAPLSGDDLLRPQAMRQLPPAKIQSQQRIPAILIYPNIIGGEPFTLQFFAIYWHKRCTWPYSSSGIKSSISIICVTFVTLKSHDIAS